MKIQIISDISSKLIFLNSENKFISQKAYDLKNFLSSVIGKNSSNPFNIAS